MLRTLKDINIEVGARIKEKRVAQKLTREELAQLSGYTANFIQEVERGRSGLSSESIRALSHGTQGFCGYSFIWRGTRRICPYLTASEVCPTSEAGTYYPNHRRGNSMHTIIVAPVSRIMQGPILYPKIQTSDWG